MDKERVWIFSECFGSFLDIWIWLFFDKFRNRPKIQKKFTRFLWSILSTFWSIKFFCKVETSRVKKSWRFFVKFENHPKVWTLQKNFIEQKVLRIEQRKRVNFLEFFGRFLNLSKSNQIQISKNGSKNSEKIHTLSSANSNHFLLYIILS